MLVGLLERSARLSFDIAAFGLAACVFEITSSDTSKTQLHIASEGSE